jgi:23S rRNA pseudouridine2457 synthase
MPNSKKNHPLYFICHKPYGMLSQFSGEDKDSLLGELYNFPKDVYPIGRLDKDSEGLLALTNDNQLKTKLLDPKNNHTKTYHVQVEGEITETALQALKKGGIKIKHKGKEHLTAPAQVKLIQSVNHKERTPPIRFRKNIPTSWLEITLTEGKNRQIRKMTAAVGYPTLRLIRVAIGKITLKNLGDKSVKELSKEEAILLVNGDAVMR